MKKIVADLHMHTLAGGHTYGAIREMAAADKEQGLKLIGISEHAPEIPRTVNPFYYSNLEVIPDVIHGIEILHGCEINVLDELILNNDMEKVKNFMKRDDKTLEK